MAEPLQYRLSADDAGWRWEVVTKNRQLIASGVAESHVEARGAAMKAGLQGFINRKQASGATMIATTPPQSDARQQAAAIDRWDDEGGAPRPSPDNASAPIPKEDPTPGRSTSKRQKENPNVDRADSR